MMREEFEQRTGIYPSVAMFEAITEAYNSFDGDKDAFCAAFKANKDGLAQKVCRECDDKAWRHRNDEQELKELRAKVEKLTGELDEALEWQDFEEPLNYSQADYNALSDDMSTERLSDEEAIDIISSEFAFVKDKIRIVREINAEQKNRRGRIRVVGKKVRKPLFNAWDWNYICFEVTGNETRRYEMRNGELGLFVS